MGRRRVEAGRAALDAEDLPLVVEALTTSVRFAVTVGNDPDLVKVALLEEALAIVPPDDVVSRARLLASLSLELILSGEFARRRPVVVELQTLLWDFPDAGRRAVIAAGLGSHQLGSDWDPAMAGALGDWIEVGIPSVRDPFTLGMLNLSLWFLRISGGDRGAADRCVARHRELPKQAALIASGGHLLEHLAAMVDGRLADAERERDAQIAIGDRMHSSETATYRALEEWTVRREQGRLGELADLFCDLLGESDRSSALGGLTALTLCAAGRLDEAKRLLADFSFDRVPDDGGFAVAQATWSEVVARLGEESLCRALLDTARSMGRGHVTTGGFYGGAASRFIALLEDRRGDHAAADMAFAAAVEDHTRLQSPPWLARTHLDWAESLLARGETTRAAAQLDAAESALGDLDLPESRTRLAALRSAG